MNPDYSVPQTDNQLEVKHECRIRDAYIGALKTERPLELFLGKELKCNGSGIRADMRTVDLNQVIRQWEFKIHADYNSLGQVLAYVALLREFHKFERDVRGVVAAFTFQPELRRTINILNLHFIELVTIPAYLKFGGDLNLLCPHYPTSAPIPFISSV